ncbi:MAG: TonB C-terminal domain-containing protein [Rhodocyclaceae bacterium]|nr:TonB C-terminal domain-containing protein [Rhodocyclaceae bacterium]MBX3669053.1 TonB C-terminal domain-containing protein [Rhodocyclaceae bacterium]
MNQSVLPHSTASDPAKLVSAVLAVSVHVLLAVILIFGVRWQNKAPAAVEVELVRMQPVSVAPPRPQPPPPKPQPAPQVQPPPAPVEVKPPPKPDIALKDKEKPKEKPKETPKPPPPDPQAEREKEREKEREQERKLMQQQLARESQRITQNMAAQEMDRLNRELRETQARAASERASALWADAISAQVRRHIVLPPGVSGNPEAIFRVNLLPDRSVMEAKLQKSTGNPALDAAIERAIFKASPLPVPTDPSAFQRDLKLKFRPLEN